MKKALTVVLILALALCSVFAGDFKFLFTELDQHPDILAGFLPTLTAIGAGYEGLSLIEGDLTQFQATIGGGYTQRVLYQNPDSGEPLISDQMLFDQIQLRWNLKFLQGFGDSWVQGKDLVTAYVGYEGRYEKAVDSMKVHEARFRGYADPVTREKGKTPIPSLAEWFNTTYDDGSGNATLKGNKIYRTLPMTTPPS